jgi:DNA repair protein RadC
LSKEEEMSKRKYLHGGHRDRLRQRFSKSGFDGFHGYEILELLLTYAIPRKDTKPIAKALIARFKSVRNVLDAPVEKLKEIEGMGDNVSVFLRILRNTISEYYKEVVSETKVFNTLDQLVDYLKAVIGGRQNEIVHVLYLNSKNELLHSENLGEGTVSEAVAFPRKIVEVALKHNATSVMLAHNHPGGLAEPSDNDNRLTDAVRKALMTINVNLQEHIIISDDGFHSYRKSGYFDIE